MTTAAPSSSQTTPAVSAQTLLSALNWRYATKIFDAQKKLTPAQWQTLEQALVLSPSSFGLQPWRFVNVVDAALRAQLKPFSYNNHSQVCDASHLVVFAAKETVGQADVDHLVETMARTQGVTPAAFEQYRQHMMAIVVNGPIAPVVHGWAARQCYIALGNLMTSAAMMGMDTCPMEGLDPAAYDKVLGLVGSGYKTVVACAVGFRSSDDKYAAMKKVRYPASEAVVVK